MKSYYKIVDKINSKLVSNISNINFEKAKMLLNVKYDESRDTVPMITTLFERLNYLFKKYKNEEIYVKSIRKYITKEIDPNYTWRFNFKMPGHEFEIFFPIVRWDGTVLLHGNPYIVIFQMIDKPIFWKKDEVIFQNNVNFTIKTENLCKEKTPLRVTIGTPKFRMPLALLLLATKGLEWFQNKFNVKLFIKDIDSNFEKGFNRENIELIKINKNDNNQYIDKILDSFYYIYEDFKDKIKFLKKSKLKHLLEDEFYIKIFDKVNAQKDIKYFNACLESLKLFDPFTYQFIEKDIVEDFVDKILEGPSNFLDIRNKRIRYLEPYYQKLCQYLFNVGSNLIYGKKIDLRNVQRFRLDDIFTVSELTMFNYRYNTMMKLSESVKLTQVGHLGLKRESFMNKRSIHPSQYGYLCPISTPDRENCGVVLHLAIVSQKDFSNFYKWPREIIKDTNNRLEMKKIDELKEGIDIDKYIEDIINENKKMKDVKNVEKIVFND